MGQFVTGFLWGLGTAPPGVTLYDDETPGGGLVDRWWKHHGDASAWCLTPRWNDDGTFGFAFALSRGHEDDDGAVPIDTPVQPESIATTEPYATALATARERWTAFDTWVQSTGVTLPPPGLWIVTTEVA